MADKKLIDNSSATTVDNFYGNQGGADVQIPLATAASVLAGIAPFGFKFVNSSNDANELADGKYYYANGNIPSNGFGSNAILIQLSHPSRGDIYQIAFDYNTRSIYARMRAASIWTAWKQLFSFE